MTPAGRSGRPGRVIPNIFMFTLPVLTTDSQLARSLRSLLFQTVALRHIGLNRLVSYARSGSLSSQGHGRGRAGCGASRLERSAREARNAYNPCDSKRKSEREGTTAHSKVERERDVRAGPTLRPKDAVARACLMPLVCSC